MLVCGFCAPPDPRPTRSLHVIFTGRSAIEAVARRLAGVLGFARYALELACPVGEFERSLLYLRLFVLYGEHAVVCSDTRSPFSMLMVFQPLSCPFGPQASNVSVETLALLLSVSSWNDEQLNCSTPRA